MRRLNISLLALLISLGQAATAEEWSKTYALQGKPDLRVETSDANITVDTWDQKSIEAHVTTAGYKMGEDGVSILEHQNGDSIGVQVHLAMQICVLCIHTRHHRVDETIHMPREGRLSLKTGDGDIKLREFKGEMELLSSDGSQEIDRVDGHLRAHAGDGHIRVNGRFDELDLSSGDGRIEARALAGSVLRSGWNVHSGDGTVRLDVPETLAADVDLHTGDGHIRVDLPVTVEGRLSGNNIRGKLNGGGNLLTVHTGDGSIEVGKS